MPTDPIDQMVERLREACRDMGAFITWDGYVSENTAAKLLGRSTGTLRNWRCYDRPLRFRKLHGRVQYQLADIAALIISADDTGD
ncbi:MAG: hypothetical protein WA161_21340 [Pseudomonas sp.]|uniref:hypothetical protein n=1 Tax=Pseudomonas sp. TaxID=306 RepID=UPI003BB63A54